MLAVGIGLFTIIVGGGLVALFTVINKLEPKP